MRWNAFFNRRTTTPSVPDGVVVFAVGDIHGRADLAEHILDVARLEADDAAGAQIVLVGLGDYVDRGPQTRELIESLVALTHHPRLETRFLRGNHEQILTAFLEDASAGPPWCEFGGRQTLASYGIQAPEDPSDLQAWEGARRAFNSSLPTAHRDFLKTLALRFTIGDYIFVHAGLRPGVSLTRQREEDMLWIREPFLTSRKPFSKLVVHGHSPSQAVHVDRRRIGLDTGAYATGVLSAVRLQGAARHLFQTTPIQDGGVGLLSRSI